MPYRHVYFLVAHCGLTALSRLNSPASVNNLKLFISPYYKECNVSAIL